MTLLASRAAAPAPPTCRQCGGQPASPALRVCRRCGLAYGSPPGFGLAPACPVCYRQLDPDGLTASLEQPGWRVDLRAHRDEHERHPVGDDDYLETLRRGDQARIGRWSAPFELLRRYLVLGVVDGGRSRAAHHNALLTAMGQLARWGADATILGDQAEWREARAAVAEVMECYNRGRR